MAMAGSVSTGTSDITGNLSGESMRIIEGDDLPRVTRVRKRRRRGSGKGDPGTASEAAAGSDASKDVMGGEQTDGGNANRTQVRRVHHQPSPTSQPQPAQPAPTSQQMPSQQPQQSHKQRQKQKKAGQRQDRPSLSPSDIYAMDETRLVELASERGIGVANLTRDQLVGALAVATAVSEGFSIAQGTLQDGEPDRMQNSYLIRTGNKGYGYGDHDAYVTKKFASQKGIRPGDMVTAIVGHKDQVRYKPSIDIIEVNGLLLCAENTSRILQSRPKFESLTPVYPDERFQLERSDGDLTGRILDLMCPLGKGQRAMIVAPPKAGKTTMMKSICHSISENSPETHIMCLLIDERPEEVTDMRRSIDGEVIASTFDHTPREHTQVAEQCLERAKRLVELGRDVVIVMDSLTRLARAYNMAGTASGRILSGGMDASALYPPKKFFGAARNIEGGGSLTIIATALVETDSKLDDVTFEELKGTGNSEIKLDRHLADRRMFPAIDIRESGTRNEELLIGGRELPMVWRLRNVLMEQEDNRKVPNGQHDTEGPWKVLTKSLRNTENNSEFLVKFMVKQSQQNNG